MMSDLRVVVSGAAGKVAYPLLYQIARGEAFGLSQPVILHMIDIAQKRKRVEGVAMELKFCAMGALRQVVPTVDPEVAFKDVDVAILLSSRPEEKVMDKRELLALNIRLFKSHGEALELYAKNSVKVLIVGEPCNTNAFICSRYAPSIPSTNFSSLSRVMEKLAVGLLAGRLRIATERVRNVIIWGNSNNTVHADLSHAIVDYPDQIRKTKTAYEAVNNEKWLKTGFLQQLQTRLSARIGNQPVALSISCAQAAVEHVRFWWYGTPASTWMSMGVISDGSYDVPPGIFFSLPVYIENKTWRVVQGLHVETFTRRLLRNAIKELVDERAEAMKLCNLKWGPSLELVPFTIADRLMRDLVGTATETREKPTSKRAGR